MFLTLSFYYNFARYKKDRIKTTKFDEGMEKGEKEGRKEGGREGKDRRERGKEKGDREGGREKEILK